MKMIFACCLSGFILSCSALAAEDACNDGIAGLSAKEISDILPLLDIDGRNDLVGFNCRDPNDKNRSIIATKIGSNLGAVYIATMTNAAPTVTVVEDGQFEVVDVLRDKRGASFLLISGKYLHQGPMSDWHLLVAFKTGKTERLAEAFEDPVDGWCGDGESYSEATASRMSYRTEPRPDGLANIVYDIQTLNCETKKTISKTLRYMPGDNGFSLEIPKR